MRPREANLTTFLSVNTVVVIGQLLALNYGREWPDKGACVPATSGFVFRMQRFFILPASKAQRDHWKLWHLMQRRATRLPTLLLCLRPPIPPRFCRRACLPPVWL